MAKKKDLAGPVVEVTEEMVKAAYDPPATIGDNRLLTTAQKEMLAGFLEELNHNKVEQDEMKARERDIYESMKGAGFNVKAVKKLRKFLELPPEEREKELTLLEVYLHGSGNPRPGM